MKNKSDLLAFYYQLRLQEGLPKYSLINNEDFLDWYTITVIPAGPLVEVDWIDRVIACCFFERRVIYLSTHNLAPIQ